MPRRCPPILTATLCAALLTIGASAQHRIDPKANAQIAPVGAPGVLLEAAHSTPADVSTLIVARNLAELRQTDASAALLAITEQMGLFPASRGAWNGLARQLGMSPEQAFDELLGEHVILMTREQPDVPGGVAWALTSRVSLSAAKQLGVALGATPRADLGGLPVFSLENGGFVLHIRPEKRGKGAWLTIGPGDHPSLFRELLDPPARVRTLASDANFADLIGALPEAGDAFVYRRFSAGAPGFAVGSVRLVSSTLAATYAAYTQGMPALGEGWSRDTFDALRHRSALTLLESGPTSARRVLDSAGGLAAMGPVRGLAAIFEPFEPKSMLGQQDMLLIRRSQGGAMGVAYAVSTPDRAALIPVADQYLAGQLAALFPRKINAAQRIDTEGYAPEAMRTVPLRGTGVAGLFRDPANATFGWVCAAAKTDDDDEPATRGAGWWVAGIDPDTIERAVEALGETTTSGEWSALGEIRPRALISLLDSAAILPIPGDDADLMRRVERITISERRLSPEKVVGSFSTEFVPATSRPGG